MAIERQSRHQIDNKRFINLSNGPIALFTPEFYATCSLGGALSCGVTHALMTPLDLVKCRRQVLHKLLI